MFDLRENRRRGGTIVHHKFLDKSEIIYHPNSNSFEITLNKNTRYFKSKWKYYFSMFMSSESFGFSSKILNSFVYSENEITIEFIGDNFYKDEVFSMVFNGYVGLIDPPKIMSI